MIIESHAHYAYHKFEGDFPYLGEREGSFYVDDTRLSALIADMKAKGIVGCIEPSIGFESIEKQLSLVKAHRGYLWATIGVHPTRCVHTAWKNREKVTEYAETEEIVAIGETGLDYHYKRKEQYRLRQKRWFVYQIKLADRLQLPLVLHIRMADRDALRILKKYKNKLHGGVVHCFSGDSHLAAEYVKLGFAIGIGGKLLCEADAAALEDAVKNVPLSHLLVETDAPFVLPDLGKDVCSKKKREKLRNTSLILPAVLERIAFLRGESKDAIEDAIYQNTLRIFRLHTENK